MKHANFVHLHNHTEYSLLDGAISIEKLVKTAGAMNLPAVAITDHGNLFGAVLFYKEAMKNGIKPIIGSEMYIAPKSRFDRSSTNGIGEAAFHLTLLAKDLQGYKNLLQLSTLSFLEGFYYRPRIDKEVLAKYSKGLIAMSGCLKGEISSNLLQDNEEQARLALFEYKQIFGEGNFFLEIMDHGLEEEHKVGKQLVALAQREKVGLVATNDIHYLHKEDSFAHEVLMCIGTGKRITDEDRMHLSTNEFYFKSPQEMEKLFAAVPQACKNTLVIADQCHLELNFSQVSLPAFAVPAGYNLDTYLEKLCKDGLKKRYDQVTPEIEKRIDYELSVIKKMGYSAYFLIVWDFIHYAKTHGIPVGPGRGSGAGSLVAYSLQITDIDPLRYGLLFERFLNPDRISMPDLDIDFSDDGREEVINYVRNKYGEKNVAQIITFGTLGAKLVVRDVARVMNIPLDEADRLAKLIPNDPGMTLADAASQNADLKKNMSASPELKQLFQVAHTLEGLTRHSSKHAAGIVITKDELTNYVPLSKNSKGQVTTQYDGKTLADIMGLLKVDFLGLRTLTVIDSACKTLFADRQVKIDINKILLDDKQTYELLSRGQTLGIFQLDSSGMRDLVRKIQPTSMEDIIALIALYRPGPMGSGMLDDFVGRKHGKIPVKYDLPVLEPILKETYGVIVYQEQVMQIAMAVAGFSAGQADILRRAMGKKNPEAIEKERKSFLEGAQKNKIKTEKATKLFDLMAQFGGYGFNKSHAAAYAYLAYQTAYLKAHYPLEFMSALLTSEIGNQDDIVLYIEEAKDMGIPIGPPHVNFSFANFKVEGNSIRFGLAAVKNVGEGAIDSMVVARQKEGVFTGFYDFCKKVDLHAVNKRVVESLIKCGALDQLGSTRMEMYDTLEMVMQKAAVLQQDIISGQTSFLDELPVEEPVAEAGKAHHKEWHENKLLEGEREVLGFYMTGHPLARFAEELKTYTTANMLDVVNIPEKQPVRVGGIIKKVRIHFTKKNEKMAVFVLEDLKGEIPVVVFPDNYNNPGINSLVKTDQTVIVCGQLDKRRAEAQVILDRILPLEQARERLTRSIHIHIKTVGLEQDYLGKLKASMAKYPGMCPVYLHLQTPHTGEVVVSPDSNVRVSAILAFQQEIESLLGKGSVQFKS